MISKRQIAFIFLFPGILGLAGMIPATIAESFQMPTSAITVPATTMSGQEAVSAKQMSKSAFTVPLLKEKRKGKFHCSGCDLEFYS